jgi:hypothetical protein
MVHEPEVTFDYQPLKWEKHEYRLVALSTAVEGGYYAIAALPLAWANGPDGSKQLPFTEWNLSTPFGRYEDGTLKMAGQKFTYTTAAFWTALEVAENTERTAQLAKHESINRSHVSISVPGEPYVISSKGDSSV